MSTPLDQIRLALVELIDEMNGDSPEHVDSQAAATNICNMALSDLKPDELDMASSLLFNPERGILYFLKKSLDKSIHVGAKATFLEFTAEFISRSPNAITPCIVDIKKTCLSLFLNDQAAKVKRSAMLPIKILLSSCNNMIDPEALDIDGLFVKLFTAYATQQSKMVSTVKAEVLEVLGTIARFFPNVAQERYSQVMRWCISIAQDQLKPGAKQELTLIAGALVGLDNCLYNFSEKAVKDVPLILQLVKTLVNVPEDLSRFAAPIAALNLFTHHIHLFRKDLIDIYDWMYQRIAGYCEHSHNEMSKSGYNALDVFLQEIADVLTTSPTTEKEYNCFLFFTANFSQIISTEFVKSSAQYKAMSVAIRGYGYFAAPCKQIAPDQLKFLLSHLLKKSAFLISSNTSDGMNGSVSHLAAFITAYTFVAQVYEEIPELLMAALNQMSKAAIVNFTKMSTYARIDCTIAIERLLIMLFHKGEGVLRGFFDKLSYKMLVFTSADVSKPTPSPYSNDRPTGTDDTTWHSYTVYLFLWRNIFNPNQLSKNLGRVPIQISDEDLDRFLPILYGSTMESFRRIVTLLNLSVSDSETNLDDEDTLTQAPVTDPDLSLGPASGDVSTMQANCVKDFIIFQNLTEFWQLFLPEIRPQLFGRWNFVIGEVLIELSAKNPLVSGFYKMFSTCLQVCQTIALFDERDGPDHVVKIDDEIVDIKHAATLYKKYIREVLARLEQYKDDLLASCLHLVLSSPAALTDSDSIIAPIQLALKLGLGYIPLASVGLDAIERWIERIDHDHDGWFGKVLPCLNEYLLVEVPSAGDGEGTSGPTTKSKQRMITRQNQQYKAVVRTASLAANQEQLQSLKELQLRILRLLGRQARHNKWILNQKSVLDESQKRSSELLAWDPEARIKLRIPFQEMKTELLFDEMLPRIVDLAENSLNRQIKVASCELLHSLVIFMVGSNAFRARDAQGPKESPFHKIYLKVFPALLRLAVDVDRVPRSLFRPLVGQLIHWLTNSAQYENPETVALLNCCMDAACDTLGPLRDYGAECLGEFVKWSVKQSSSSKGSVNVKSVLKRVYNLASHTSPAKRLGAALIVNRIYRVFREESTLVNQFTMELLYWMLFSLKFAEADPPGLGTRQQTCTAISHLQRIIQVKSALFLKTSSERRRFPGADEATLDSLVQWLLRETSRSEVEYTKMCRSLFDSFVKLLPGTPAPGAWIGTNVKENPSFLSAIYSVPEFSSQPIDRPIAFQKWCAQLASTLSNYSWLLNHSESADRMAVTLVKSSPVLKASKQFLETCLEFTRALTRGDATLTTTLTAQERRQIMDQNFITVRKLIVFVTRVSSRRLDRGDKSFMDHLLSSKILGSAFFEVFAACMFMPDSIGNDELLKSENETKVWRDELESALKVFKQLPEDSLAELGKIMMNTISYNDLVPLAISMDSRGQDAVKCKGAVDGIEMLQRCEMLDCMFDGSASQSRRYIESLFDTFMTLQTTQDPLWINYCSSLLRVSLTDSQCQRRLWAHLLNAEKGEQAKMTYLKYTYEINCRFALDFSELSPVLKDYAKTTPLLLFIWNDFLEFLFTHPELQTERDAFLEKLSKDYSLLKSIVDTLGWEQVSMTISIWKRIIALSPRLLRMSKSESFVDYFFDVFQTFFERDSEKNEYLTMPVMSEAFPILPIFLSYDGARTKQFEVVFNRAILNVMPTVSSEYEEGGSKFKDYIAALDLLLKALVASTSPSLFKTLMGIAIRESNHPHMEQIQRSMSSFALKLPLAKFLEVTTYCFEEFYKKTHADEHRKNIVQQVLLPILRIVPPLSVNQFYTEHIPRIMGGIKQEPPRVLDADIRRDYLERGCYYDLVHVLYMRLPSDMVNSKESRIVDAYTGGKTATGKEMTVDVFRTANAAKFKQDSTSLTPETALVRDDFKRSAYNALAAAILCTQRKEDFFRQFLFSDKEAKKEFVFENIVDLTARYDFKQVLSKPWVKTRLSDLRSKSLNSSSSNVPRHQYMSSQYLRDSSLSQSVGILDEGMYSDNIRDTDLESSQGSDKTGEGQKVVETKTDPSQESTLELDELNKNPCMKMILLAIKELHSSITPPPAELATEDAAMPSWMRDLYRKFVNPSSPLNVRLFLAKIIINMPEAFEMYAGSWIRPLMRLAMEGESYGEPMSYFVQDLCVLVVVWGASVKLADNYEDRVLLLSFLSYMMKHCYHEQRQYLLNSIELIKGVFENWSSIAIVPTTIIYNNFKNIKDEKRNVTGIQLLGIVLTHDNPPFYSGPEIDLGTLQEEEFYETLVRNMGSSLKQLYTSTAEVCGLALAYMKKHHCMNNEFQDMVTKKLSELLLPPTKPTSGSKNGTVQFLNSLHKVQLNYPEITDAFGPRLLFLFPQFLGEERTLALEILAGRAAHLPDLLQSLQGLNFLGCLKHKDEATQFASLSIIYGLCDSLKPAQIKYFLDTLILEFSNHSSVECRKLYYSILMVLYDKQAQLKEVVDELRPQLLRGLGDPSESIRHTVVEFWYGKNRLPNDTFLRLGEIVRNMYDAQAEDKFLNYATYMILDRTKKSSDYSEPIFTEPLPNAKFNDQFANIDTSWRNTSAMTPLFVQTQQSQSQTAGNDITMADDELKATQSTFEFSMTLDGGAQGIRSQLGGSSTSNSTLLFKNPPIPEGRSGGGTAGLTLGTQLSAAGANQKYRRLQYRSVKTDQVTQSQRFKKAYETKMQNKMLQAVDREIARAKSVSMIRKYRDGDLPDIQISYSDIIRPLQSLAEMDVDICRMLFSKLVTSLMGQVDSYNEMSEDEANQFKETLVGDFKQILQKSTMLYTPFVGSILRICHDYGEADIPADLVSKVAIRSSNQHLGIILIEKQIQNYQPRERSAKRQKTSSSGAHDPKRQSWIELARIYKSVDEKDVFKSIYESKIATTTYTREAIEAEVIGDYDRAVRVYFDGITRLFENEFEIDEAEKNIWAQGRLECLEHLGNWDTLEENMISDLDHDPREVWTEEYLDPYLYYYLTSYIKLVDGRRVDEMLELWSADNPNPLFKFIDDAMNHPVHQNILTSQYQPELAMAAVIRQDFKQASHYVKKSFDRFLSVWSNLHPLSEKPRLHELSGLQRVVEMEEFLEGIDVALRGSAQDPLIPLLAKWENRFPGKTTDTMITWNNVLDDRNAMITRLEGQINFSRAQEREVTRHCINNYKHMGSAAREQGNHSVAEICIVRMRELQAPAFDIYQSQIKLALEKANIEMDGVRKAEALVDALSTYEEAKVNIRSPSSSESADLSLLGSKAYGLLRDLVVENPAALESVRNNEDSRKFLASRSGDDGETNISLKLQRHGFQCLRSVIGENMSKKLRLTTAKYCDNILRHHDKDDKGPLALSAKDEGIYSKMVVKHTLLTMREDDGGASELFPRLLQIIEKPGESRRLFLELVSDFPRCWTFVRWIPQMVAVLDKSIGTCVMPILLAIAKQYPNALYYPLTISSENYVFENSASGEKLRSNVQMLKKLVHSPLKEDFILELRRLTNPEHIMKDFAEQLRSLVTSKVKDTEKIMALYQDVRRLLLDPNNPRLGTVGKAIASKFGPKLDSLCGSTGKTLASAATKDLHVIIKMCHNDIQQWAGSRKPSDGGLLKAYSPWLSSFQSSDHEGTIDIPGQYNGRNPPQQISTIVRFDQRILTMSSIRKPKRICILGSDEKEYMFLVKGGEDLRLDQRIQQLFSLMNDIMRKDPQCSRQDISIGTYSVIPMSLSLGILEWVDNTVPLRHCIESQLSRKEMWRKGLEQYSKFMDSFKGDIMGYPNMFIHASRDKVTKNLEALYSFYREDLLRTSITQLAASPEAFLMLRSEFAKSLAAISVCSYLLGIGDRHLENFLVDKSTGCMIPIDFGHAFGSATEVLPVPELVPFRLTRQLSSFLNPLGPKGLLEHPMVCIMKALQNKKDVILNTMDVFVKEPLLDWRKFAVTHARQLKKQGADMESFEIDEASLDPPAWYLQQKMDNARKKLEGYNPAYLTVSELKMGHSGKSFYNSVVKIALGDAHLNVRAQYGEVCPSVQAQVECLIDMATDPDVLGRCWSGWHSWI
ncbi:DNA-dependent protein kinase catalytic subunit [Entomortierella parvispora]|uniref:DNA-dependent protein kinase catalytic subunit n=1 Tax=Entomortierella parvispora TaxID=205924 RepID=A0A9P3M0J5_9FUNG|nr:DNA-dependent protein kinase catalytic subunit [Entomortierella parvispora]